MIAGFPPGGGRGGVINCGILCAKLKYFAQPQKNLMRVALKQYTYYGKGEECMPCYHPVVAYRSKAGRNSNGAWPIVFNPRDGYIDREVQIPCGQCIGCKLERSRQWAVRCMLEADQYKSNSFITLTYDNAKLNAKVIESINKIDFKNFVKRLRKHAKFRYFQCGEYGEKTERPHHHACIFGFDFPDKKMWGLSNDIPIYKSELLDEKWGLGNTMIGELTFESAAYVARYITKKITGDDAAGHYKGRMPEYVTMSRRPGIGADWINSFYSDVYPLDTVVLSDKRKCKPPRYFDEKYKKFNDIGMEDIKRKRVKKALSNPDNCYDRLTVKEKIKKLQAKKLIRKLEETEYDLSYLLDTR